ncbi:MAG: L,D-transpeptidase family protein [Phycisphaerae bacterium]|nr:L,D-transpeptidase family protein [Phycisphaerae bacterium]
MARVLRPNRVGLAVIAAAAVVLLVVVILWVRGCGEEPQAQPPEIPERTVEAPPERQPTPAPAPEPKPVESKPIVIEKTSVYQRWYDAGREAFDSGDYINARHQLSQALKGLENPSRLNAKIQLATIANKLTFTRQIFPGDTTAESYHVKQGETPAGVVKDFAITAELFMKINNIPDAKLMIAGKNYKVIKGPFSVVIHKKTFELDVFLGDYFIKRYPIGLGRDNSTPVGEFLAGSRLEKPPWTGEDPKTGRRILVRHGDPGYPLGDHWISLRELPEHGGKDDTTYGIHGTNEPETIGGQASRGCIRMLNKDMAELFDLLVSGKSRITLLDD